MALVEYLVARDGPPPRRGLAYDYLLAGDGLYVATEGPHLAARVPVARATVGGSRPSTPASRCGAGGSPRASGTRSSRPPAPGPSASCSWP